MKKFLKNQAGVAIIAIILVTFLAVAGGGAAFLAVRMVVSGDGNFLQPFEELGWIEPKDDEDDEDEAKEKDVDDDDDEDDEDDKDSKKEKEKKEDDKKDDSKKEDDKKDDSKKDDSKKTSGDSSKYLVDESRLSSEAKKSNVDHYYGEIDLASTMGDSTDDEFADLYKLLKAAVNLYAQDGKTVEIEFGFDISEFCKEAYEKYKDEFAQMGMTSASALEEMMMGMIESMFNEMDDDTSDYISKYVDGGKLQLYVTEKGFEKLYETYDIENGSNDIDVLKKSLEDSFNTKISLVK